MPPVEKDSQFTVDDAVAFGILKEKVKYLEKELEEALNTQEKRILALEKDRDSALRWGIMILGTSVISMGVWIFKFLASKIPGVWDKKQSLAC